MTTNYNTYSVSIYTENQIGLLAQISNIFTRRSLSIWSLLAKPTRLDGIHSITIVTDGPEKKIIEAVKQLDKRIDVIKAFYAVSDRYQLEDPGAGMHLEEVSAFMEERKKQKQQQK